MSIEHMGMVYAAGGIPGPEKALLLAFTNFTDPHGYCWPGEDRLADMTGTSVRTVRRSRAKLITMNLIKSVRRTDKITGDPITNLTRVNLRLIASMKRPDPVYDDNMIGRILFDDDEDPEAEPSTVSTQTASDLLTGQIDLRQGTDCPEGEDTLSCGTGQIGLLSVSEPSVDPSGEPADAPSGRSPVDDVVLQPEVVGDLVEGGVAASSKSSPPDHQHDDNRPPQTPKNSSSKAQARHTRAELGLVRAVRAYYPEHLLTGWTNPDTRQAVGPLPDVPELSQAILEALAGDAPGADRTVVQLGARIAQRWNQHGWADRFYAGELRSPVGAAVAMVRPLRAGDRYGCPNPRCEAGTNVDSGADCTACVERRADRRRDEAASPGPVMPVQRATKGPAAAFRECAELVCGLPLARASSDNLCPGCREKADRAVEYAAAAPF